jgi:hypothetical protein
VYTVFAVSGEDGTYSKLRLPWDSEIFPAVAGEIEIAGAIVVVSKCAFVAICNEADLGTFVLPLYGNAELIWK